MTFVHNIVQDGEPERDQFANRVFTEGILNIVRVIKDVVDDPSPSPDFGRPQLFDVHAGRLYRLPDRFPVVDVAWKRFLGVVTREMGSEGGELWRLLYSIQYYHDELSPDVRDIDATRQMDDIFNIFTHYCTLNGWCRDGVELEAASQDIERYGDLINYRNVVGGAIVIRVDHWIPTVTKQVGDQIDRRFVQQADLIG